MKRKFFLLLGLVLAICASCIQARRASRFAIRFDGPAFPKGFQCVGVVVTGEGIPAQDNPNGQANWQAIYQGGACPYAGVSTTAKPLVAGASTADFDLVVPSGRNRTIQVVGVQTASGGCPTKTLSELLIANSQKQPDPDVLGLYELGRQYLDTYHAASVTIRPTYDASSATNLLKCDAATGGGGGGELSELFPFATVTLFAGDPYFLKPTGGTAPYTFTKTSGQASMLQIENGSLALVTGFSAPDTAVVEVEDSTHKKATVTFLSKTMTPFGPLKHRFAASSYGNIVDGGTIDGSNYWTDNGTGGLSLRPPSSNSSITYSRNGGPRRFASVSIGGASSFLSSPSFNVINGQHSIVAVVRQAANSSVSVLCMADFDCLTGTYSLLKVGAAANLGMFLVSNGGALASASPSGAATDGWQLFAAHFSINNPQTIDLTVGEASPNVKFHTLSAFGTGSNAIIRLGGASGSGAEANIEVAEVIVIEASNNTGFLEQALKTKYGL